MSGGSATAAATRRATRSAAPAPAARAAVQVKDTVAFDMPVASRKSEDIFVQLTTALTMRMNPPPDPPADLRLSTGVWLLATAAGVGLWVLSFLHDDLLKYVWAVGGFEFAIGIIWVIHRVGRRRPADGLLAIVPPVTVYHLVRNGGPDGYRPLRFVLSGLLLVGLTFIAIPCRAVVRTAMGWSASSVASDRSDDSPAAKFRQVAERSNNAEQIQKELIRLASADRSGLTAKDQSAMVAEFRNLLKNDSIDVRGEALRTLFAWEKTAAWQDVEFLLSSEYRDDRAAALALVKNWKSEEAVAAAVGRLASDDDRFLAKDAVLEMGKSVPKQVEKVLLDRLLKPAAQDPIPAKTILDLLESVGGPVSVADLAKYGAACTDPFLQDLANQKRLAIEARIRNRK